MDNNEIWKEIPSKPGYEASNMGNIRNAGHVTLIHVKNKYTYLRYYPPYTLKQTQDGGYLKTHLGWTHRLVCEAFNGEMPENCTDVNHLNENKLDNRPENLVWCTRQENCNYGTRIDRIMTTKLKKKLKEQLDKMELIYPGFTAKALSFFIE